MISSLKQWQRKRVFSHPYQWYSREDVTGVSDVSWRLPVPGKVFQVVVSWDWLTRRLLLPPFCHLLVYTIAFLLSLPPSADLTFLSVMWQAHGFSRWLYVRHEVETFQIGQAYADFLYQQLFQHPQLLRRNEFLLRHSPCDPRERLVNGLFYFSADVLGNAWGKADLNVGSPSEGKGVFSFVRFVVSPASDFWNRFVKIVFVQLLLPQEVSMSWRMADTLVWLLKLDCWPEIYKSSLIHHVAGDCWWGLSEIPEEKNSQVNRNVSY